MILVTSAFGNQGKILIPKLRAAGFKVRAMRATAGGGEELVALGADEVIIGDLSDRATLRKAVSNVDTIYHVGPSAHPLEREIGLAIVDVATAAGVGHFIFSSVLHPIISRLLQHKIKRDIEEHVIESGINFTVLQPSDYMLPLLLKPAFETGTFELSWDLDRRQAMIDLHDLADVVVRIVREREAHFAATYELTSPGAHSARDIGAALSAAMGRHIAVKQVSPDTYLDAFYGSAKNGNFKHQYAVFRAISLWYSQYDFVGNSNVLEWLLGRKPATLQEFVNSEWRKHREMNGSP